LVAKHFVTFKSERQAEADVATYSVEGERIVLAIPKTYMNESGRAVQRLLRFYEGQIQELLVVIDDIETPWGTSKLAFEGGTRGHNGIRSIHQHVESKAFTQLRVGVGHPGAKNVADYVLDDFTKEELEELPEIVEKSVGLIENWILGLKKDNVQ